MQKLYTILSWVGGVWASLTGLVFLTMSIIGGIAFILIGLLLLPPARNYIFSKYKVSITTTTRAFLILVLFFTSMGFIIHDSENSEEAKAQKQAQELAGKKKQEQQANLEHFTKNKASVLSTLQNLFNSKDYKTVVTEAKKYMASNDAELKAIHDQAKEQLLLSELNSIKIEPATFNRLLSTYQQLATLNPSSKNYKDSADYYAKQIKIVEEKQKEEARKQQEAVQRKKMLESQFSAWDGSHRGLEKYIKDNMNDPDSYKHVETRYIDKKDHLIVITTFRGKNAFGGVVKNSVAAEVDLQGNVMKIIK